MRCRRVGLNAARHDAALQVGLERVAVLLGLGLGVEGGEVGPVEQLTLDARLDAAVLLLNVLRPCVKHMRKGG